MNDKGEENMNITETEYWTSGIFGILHGILLPTKIRNRLYAKSKALNNTNIQERGRKAREEEMDLFLELRRICQV